jgi:mono/diheme cytochrome c family protein
MHPSTRSIPERTLAPRPPAAGRPPALAVMIAALAIAASMVPLAIGARARVSTSEFPRVQPLQDMARQPKFGPQSANPFFEDGRAMRSPVSNTVARGRTEADDHFYRGFNTQTAANGIESMTYFDGFPNQMKVTPESIARGEQRFNIYCAACHGRDGSGTGPVHRRAAELALQQQANWIQPADLRSEMVRLRPEGHIFKTITMGIRSMPAHGPQIPVADRWAIVAYVRALQLSSPVTPSPATQPATAPVAAAAPPVKMAEGPP